MNKHLTATLVTCLLVTGQASADPELSELYFSARNPVLTHQEKQAMAIANKWKSHNAIGMAPTPGKNGAVTYLFGVQQPSVVCAVLQVCDVALQAGEQVNSINLGDTARWTLEPAITGSGDNEVQHIIIKPMDVGLETRAIALCRSFSEDQPSTIRVTQTSPKFSSTQAVFARSVVVQQIQSCSPD